ncbi:hypothetical protein FACS1894199_15440 [Bacteroidia bacterium]|nr:hypothetical protein FACS1894199_15440 [Bacteroidia bacterium]
MRCNSIKEKHIDAHNRDIHNPCDSTLDISRVIKCLCPNIPDNDIMVEPQDTSEKTQNTATLLNYCYNEGNTGIRDISRKMLHDKIFEDYVKFLGHWLTLHTQETLQSEKSKAKEHLTNMVSSTYPFSVFWKWHIRSDAFLSPQFPNV